MASSRKSLLNPMMKHRKRLAETTMRELFAADPKRFKQFSVKAGDILLDYSKNRIDEKAMADLVRRSRARRASRSAATRCGRGEHINTTEDRAVMHMALRYQGDQAGEGRRRGRHAATSARFSRR